MKENESRRGDLHVRLESSGGKNFFDCVCGDARRMPCELRRYLYSKRKKAVSTENPRSAIRDRRFDLPEPSRARDAARSIIRSLSHLIPSVEESVRKTAGEKFFP
jgi:hypothetical protein